MRAFRTFFLAAFSPFSASFFCTLSFWVPTAALSAAITSCSERCAYQMSMVRICANPAIASRYAVTDASVTACASAWVSSLLRAAIVKLAAMRLTSYSNGPGSVSSKSFRSNSNARSGDAKMPKFDRCASPQSWTVRLAFGVSFRSAAMILAAPR